MRRGFFLINNQLELRYLRLLALSMMLPTFIVGGCLYYVIFYLMAKQIGIPEIIVEQLMPVVGKVNIILAFSLPVLFLIIISIGILLAKDLAGPIERLESELEDIISKNLVSKRLSLRKKDELKPMIDSVNIMLDKIEKSSL